MRRVIDWYKSKPGVVYFTTKLYPLETEESITTAANLTLGRLQISPYSLDPASVGIALTAGELRTIVLELTTWPTEPTVIGIALTAGELRTIVDNYEDWPEEPVTAGIALTAAELRTIVLSSNMQTESINVGISLTAGALV